MDRLRRLVSRSANTRNPGVGEAAPDWRQTMRSRMTIAALVLAAVKVLTAVSRSMPPGPVSVSNPPVTFNAPPLPSVIAPAVAVSVAIAPLSAMSK